jgi:hypothetical protein
MRGITFHGVDQIGNQIRPALELIFHLRPGGIDLLF